MVQESATTWDLRNMPEVSSAELRIFAIFILIAGIVMLLKAVAVCRLFLPSVLSLPKTLQTKSALHQKAHSLKQWAVFILISWGLYASVATSRFCRSMSLTTRVLATDVLHIALDLSSTVSLTLIVTLGLFLIRWRISKAIERVDANERGINAAASC